MGSALVTVAAWGRRAWPAGALVAVAIACGACAVHRAELSEPELERRRMAYLDESRRDMEDLRAKVAHRMHLEHEAYRAALARGESPEPPALDVLVLSGGGDYGAFGAGFLDGWGRCTRTGPCGAGKRPDFDVVTGVSTGALIAPFAFIGDDDSAATALRLYREPKKDWVVLRDIFFFLPGRESFMSTKGLERDIKAQISPGVVARIAERSREGRVLAIGATNLDLGTLKVFRLSAEAERADATGDLSRVHDILLASSAIPAAFPPRVIDDTLYVDGGTTANILIEAEMRSPNTAGSELGRLHPGTPMPAVRYWVIINNQLGAAPTVVQPSWESITGASVSTAIRSSTIGSLRMLELQTRYMRDVLRIDAQFRYVAIPDDWRPPREGIFQKETMESLAELGEAMGQDPGVWRSALGTEPGSGATPGPSADGP
jgi:predicted acylesterase/phospholipase RssA